MAHSVNKKSGYKTKTFSLSPVKMQHHNVKFENWAAQLERTYVQNSARSSNFRENKLVHTEQVPSPTLCNHVNECKSPFTPCLGALTLSYWLSNQQITANRRGLMLAITKSPKMLA